MTRIEFYAGAAGGSLDDEILGSVVSPGGGASLATCSAMRQAEARDRAGSSTSCDMLADCNPSAPRLGPLFVRGRLTYGLVLLGWALASPEVSLEAGKGIR